MASDDAMQEETCFQIMRSLPKDHLSDQALEMIVSEGLGLVPNRRALMAARDRADAWRRHETAIARLKAEG